VPQDYNKAVEWYRKAAEQDEPAAQYSLGLMYDQGTGVPRNLSEATRWYRLAAKNGDPDARAVLRAQGKATPPAKPAPAAKQPRQKARDR
jgi:hypothetical protein